MTVDICIIEIKIRHFRCYAILKITVKWPRITILNDLKLGFGMWGARLHCYEAKSCEMVT